MKTEINNTRPNLFERVVGQRFDNIMGFGDHTIVSGRGKTTATRYESNAQSLALGFSLLSISYLGIGVLLFPLHVPVSIGVAVGIGIPALLLPGFTYLANLGEKRSGIEIPSRTRINK